MDSHQLKRGAILSYAGVAFNALAGLLYTPWMISRIGTGDYGLYTLALSVINFFLLDFGLGDAVSRFLSKYRAEGDRASAERFLGIAYRFYFIIDAVILVTLVALFFFVDTIYASLSPEDLAKFKVLYAVVAFYSVVSFPFLSFTGILTASEQFIGLNACNLLQKVSTVALIVASLLMGYGVYSLVAVNAVTALVFLLIKYLIIRHKTPVRPDFTAHDKKLAKEVMGFSGWTTVVSFCGRLIFAIMPSILAALSNTWEIALFGLASSLEGYMFTVADALGSMFMPRISQIVAGPHATEHLQSLTERVSRIEVSIIGLLFVGFVGTGQLFIDCWVGPQYALLYPCTILLVIPSLIELPQTVANTAITVVAAVRGKAIVYVGMAITNLVLGIGLSALYGAQGACVSICIAYIVRTAGMNVLYKQDLGLCLGRYFHEAYGRWVLPAFLSVMATFLLRMTLHPQGWAGFLMAAAAVASVYTVGLWLFYLRPEDKQTITSDLSHFGRH